MSKQKINNEKFNVAKIILVPYLIEHIEKQIKESKEKIESGTFNIFSGIECLCCLETCIEELTKIKQCLE